MDLTIITTVEVVVHVLIILFLMKLLVDPREFFFNSALRPIDSVTDPILERLRRYFRPTRFGLDYTPIVGIFMLITIYILTHWILTPADLFLSILLSFQKLLLFLLRFFAFSVLVLFMVPVYSRNPVSGFLKKLIIPFEKPFRKVTEADDKKPALTTALISGLLLGIALHVLLESFKTSAPIDYLAFWKNWIMSTLTVLSACVSIYRFIIFLLIISVVLSWLSAEMRNPFVNLIFVLTEPILLPFRRFLPPAGGLDLTPWVASIVLGFLGNVTTRLLLNLRAWLL